MKQIILTILRRGFSTTKRYTVADLVKKFYPLKYILEEKDGMIRCNGNAFWKPENNQKRMELFHDLNSVRLHFYFDMFDLYNRFENGDGYGIERTR